MLVPREIFALENIAGTDNTRFALGGIKFYRSSANGKPMACAADGKRAIIAQWDEDDPSEYPPVGVCDPSPSGDKFEAIIGVDACKRIPKMAPKAKRSAKPILRNIVLDEHSLQNDMLGVGATDLNNPEVASIKVLEGMYPRIHDAVPRVDDECTSVILDGKLLLGMLQSLTKIVKNGDTCNVTFTLRDHKSPVLMTAHDYEKRIRTVGVLMPLVNNGEKPKPGWLPADDEDEGNAAAISD